MGPDAHSPPLSFTVTSCHFPTASRHSAYGACIELASTRTQRGQFFAHAIGIPAAPTTASRAAGSRLPCTAELHLPLKRLRKPHRRRHIVERQPELSTQRKDPVPGVQTQRVPFPGTWQGRTGRRRSEQLPQAQRSSLRHVTRTRLHRIACGQTQVTGAHQCHACRDHRRVGDRIRAK